MPYSRFSRSRRQPKWITKQILEDFPTKRPAHPAKIVKHISGPLADGSFVKEISDFEVYIKAVFSSESLNEIRREDDSQLDWSKALIIVNQYTVEFKCHEELIFCEFYIKIEKFQIWDVQEGFDLKEDVKFCMDNTAVQEKAKFKWEEMRTCHSESFSLTQFLEAMMQKDSDLSLSPIDRGDDSQNTTQDESQSFTVTNCATTENPLDVLKAAISVGEFRISDSQQRELEDLREWDEDYIPTQSQNESPPVDSGQPHYVDSPDDIQPGQPNQDQIQIIIKSERKKSKENRLIDKKVVRLTEAEQQLVRGAENEPCCKPNTESMTSSNGAENTKETRQSENKDSQKECVNQNNTSFGGTQEFVPHLIGDDVLSTAPFSPQLSSDISEGQISLANNSAINSGDNLLIQDTSPILISSSGEANNSTGETPKNSGNESRKSSSDEPQFHLCRPNLSVSPENSTENSRESPRLNRLTLSAKKTFQSCFESMIENERLKRLATSSAGDEKQQQSRSRKRLLEESSEEEASDKKQRTENSENPTTEGSSIKKSTNMSRGGLVSNVMDKLRSFIDERTDLTSENRASLENRNFVDIEENNQNLSSSTPDEPDEESQSIIQSCKGLSKGSNDKRRLDTFEKSRPSSEVISRNDFASGETKQNRCPSGQEDVPILIDTNSTEEANSQEACCMASQMDSENQAHAALIEQDQEISSSIESRAPSVVPVHVILPKQTAPDDEIGQKLFNLKLPPNLKTKLLNYWKT